MPRRPVLTLATSTDTPPVGRRSRLPRLLATLAWPALVLAGGALVALTVYPNPHSAAPPGKQVIASLPYWSLDHGTGTVLSNRRTFTEVSPWIYGLDDSGRIVAQYSPGQAAAVAGQLGQLRAAGVPIVPTIANITHGNWSYHPVARVLHNPALMARHIAAIVALVEEHRYAGIDIDYEDLRASDRAAFTSFVTRLAATLHAKGKTLSVALFAKTTNAGTDPRNIAQDYAAIGRAADQVRLMCYDYHWTTSPPGPIAPIWWVREVVRYAKTQIPAHKIILGIPLFGYDWVGHKAIPVSWLQAFRLATEHHVRLHFEASSQAPWFDYTDKAGRKHQVWFENVPSSKAKFGVALGSGVGGVYLWIYGYEDTGTWAALRHTLPIARHSAHPPASRPTP